MAGDHIGRKAKKKLERGLGSLSEGHSEHEEIDAHREGPVARTIEYQTARIPSDLYLWAAFAAGGAALIFGLSGRKSIATALAQVAPALLTMGVYNKIVKVAGSDRLDQGRPLFSRNRDGSQEATLH